MQVSWGAAGPGQFFSTYNGTVHTAGGEDLDVYADMFGEQMYFDPRDCEPKYLAGIVANVPAVPGWSGFLYVDTQPQSLPDAIYRSPSICWA
jgi:hypothetical protein